MKGMIRMSSIRLLGLAGLIVGIILLGSLTLPPSQQPVADFDLDLPDLGVWEKELTDGTYFTIVDEDNNILDKTVREVHPEDEFIAGNNRHYRVERVEGNTAYAKLLMENALSDLEGNLPATAITVQGGKKHGNDLIAMYHTHSAESYVPTDGTDSIPGNGGIYKVGEQIAAKLEEKGVKVVYDKTPHEPHDADAYRRSRRTAVELMKKAPAAIIDIHRDGVPDPDFYYNNVVGQDVTKVRLVVGRQNQNMQSNLNFAKQIKAKLDEYYPGLVQGIFMAKGNYNQDLSPRSILIEVGTHTNDRNLAENGAALFADAIPAVLGISTGEKTPAPPIDTNPGDSKSLWWLIAIALIGGGLFLLLSTGSIKGSINKLKQFSSREWSSFLGNPHTSKETGNNEQENRNDRDK